MIYAYTRPRYQVSVYRTIGPLVCLKISQFDIFQVHILQKTPTTHTLTRSRMEPTKEVHVMLLPCRACMASFLIS